MGETIQEFLQYLLWNNNRKNYPGIVHGEDNAGISPLSLVKTIIVRFILRFCMGKRMQDLVLMSRGTIIVRIIPWLQMGDTIQEFANNHENIYPAITNRGETIQEQQFWRSFRDNKSRNSLTFFLNSSPLGSFFAPKKTGWYDNKMSSSSQSDPAAVKASVRCQDWVTN